MRMRCGRSSRQSRRTDPYIYVLQHLEDLVADHDEIASKISDISEQMEDCREATRRRKKSDTKGSLQTERPPFPAMRPRRRIQTPWDSSDVACLFSAHSP